MMLSLPVYLMAAAGDGGLSHREETLLICEETTHLFICYSLGLMLRMLFYLHVADGYFELNLHKQCTLPLAR